MKQVIGFHDTFFIMAYNDNILTNCGILLKNDLFFEIVKYLSVHCWCEPFWEFITKWNYVAKNLNNHKKVSFYDFSKTNIYTMCQNVRLLC